MTTLSVFEDGDFESAAKVFDDIWGWELNENAASERDHLALLYTAGAVASSNWIRVVRDAETGQTAPAVQALLCAHINGVTQTARHDCGLYTALALHYREAMQQTPQGRWILDFYEKLEAVNARLLAQMRSQGLSWDAELKLLITSPATRGKGYAGALIDACLSETSAAGGRAAMLLTDTHCSWQYYERHGWTIAAREQWTDGSGITGFAFYRGL